MNKITTKRPRRASINGVRNVMTVTGKVPDRSYRIVNDSGDRVAQFEEMGYEIVSDDGTITVGDRRIANPTREGSPVQVSVGGGQKAFLMSRPMEYRLEDDAAKEAHIKKLEEGLKVENRKSADYGKFQIN